MKRLSQILAILLVLCLAVCAGAGFVGTQKPNFGMQLNPFHPLAPTVGWVMNEGSGVLVNNVAGNSLNGGEVVGATWATKRFGSCLYFDATSDNINCGNVAQLNGVNQFTIVCQLVLSAITSWGTIWEKQADATHRLVLQQDGNDLYAIVCNGSSAYGYTTGNIISINTTYDVAIVYNGGGATNADKLKLYLDGVYHPFDAWVGTIPAATASNDNSFALGGIENNSALGYFCGGSIYNHVLSASETAQLHSTPYCMFHRPMAWLYGFTATPSGGSTDMRIHRGVTRGFSRGKF